MTDKSRIPESETLRSVLSLIGVAFRKIKFGGVVGKQTILGIIGAVVLAAIAWRTDPKYAWILGIAALALVLTVAILNYTYADRHPGEATLEGAEIIAFHQLELGTDKKVYAEDEFIKLKQVKNPAALNPSREPSE